MGTIIIQRKAKHECRADIINQIVQVELQEETESNLKELKKKKRILSSAKGYSIADDSIKTTTNNKENQSVHDNGAAEMVINGQPEK